MFILLERRFSHMNAKSQLGNLQGIILTLVVVGVLIGAAFFILGEFQDQVSDLGATEAVQGINDTVNALDNVPSLLPLVVLIAMVVIILALVFTIPGARGA
jgi:hypothetical protein